VQINPEVDLVLERTLTVPPALVWRCWTEPALICQWFCPKPWFVSEAVTDLRAGGRFFTLMNGPGGEKVPNEGSFLEVVAPSKLVFTDILAEDFAPMAAPESGAGLRFVAIVTFTPNGDGTDYRAVVRHRNAADAQTHAQMGFHQGWGSAADQLEDLAQTLMRQERQITLTRLIHASAENVWRCWTDPMLLPQWFGPEGFSCTTKEIDLRQGGQWRFDMLGPDGTVWPNRHRFTLHDPKTRIEFLMDADNNAHLPMQVQVTITPEGAATRLTQTITFPTPEARQGALAYGADRLGMQTHAKLAAVAEAL
jgi:uncharacterized protein YndB with AHSA1/START domain